MFINLSYSLRESTPIYRLQNLRETRTMSSNTDMPSPGVWTVRVGRDQPPQQLYIKFSPVQSHPASSRIGPPTDIRGRGPLQEKGPWPAGRYTKILLGKRKKKIQSELGGVCRYNCWQRWCSTWSNSEWGRFHLLTVKTGQVLEIKDNSVVLGH